MSPKLKIARKITPLVTYFSATTLVIVFGYPVLWLLYTSFKTMPDILGSPWPSTNLTTKNILQAWDKMNYPLLLSNSLTVMVVVVGVTVMISAMAAYSFSKLKYSGRYAIFLIVIGAMLIPVQVRIIPLFLILKSLNLLNLLGVILPEIAINIPMATFILTGFFKQIPKELIESAEMDGAPVYYIFLRIVLPLSKAALSTVAIIVGIQSWCEFMLPLVVARDESMYTLPLGVTKFKVAEKYTPWELLFPALLLCILPSILAYIVMQKSFEKGIMMGATKG